MGPDNIGGLISYLLALRRYGPIQPWEEVSVEVGKCLSLYLPKEIVRLVQEYFAIPRRMWDVRCVLWFSS